MIYRRFTEKSAEEWRQIYKALQLLEFLIKHGSERVVDDARSHLTLLKMLRQFHFIDANGKDQGVNVRNRAKELADLLSDVDRIRQERKKARANKAKYTGVEGGAGAFSSGSRYGGFGNESGRYGGSNAGYGGYSGGVYGDGGGFGGQADDFRETQQRGEQFEEYDEFDEGDRPARSTASPVRVKRTTASAGKAPEPPKKKEPEVDLFSFDEPAAPSIPAVSTAASSGLGSLASNNDEDDEFDDFQSATPSTQTVPPPRSFVSPPMAPQVTSHASNVPFAQPQPVSAPQQANLGSMVGLSSISPQPTAASGANYSAFSTPLTPATLSPQTAKAAGYQPTGPNYFTSVPVSAGPTTSATLGAGAGRPSAKPSASGGDAFGALWSSAAGGIKKDKTSAAGPAMGQLAKEKSAAGIWGASAPPPKPTGGSSGAGNGLDSLL